MCCIPEGDMTFDAAEVDVLRRVKRFMDQTGSYPHLYRGWYHGRAHGTGVCDTV